VYFNKYSGNNQTEIQKLYDVMGDGFGPTANTTQTNNIQNGCIIVLCI